jgi:PhnB protein
MQVQPYLFYEGRCEEAIDFYRGAVGAEVQMLMRFKDAPDKPEHLPPGSAHKVMHATLKIGSSSVSMSDGHCSGTPRFAGLALSLTVADQAIAQRTFAGLSNGGEVSMPLAKTFFSPLFGMVTDRFGLLWMVMLEA